MSKPLTLDLLDWNKMVHAFHSESDRGAALIAGGFVEHALGSYLRALATVPTIAEELFAPMGPLSSFSQRTAVAYAYGFICKTYYDDLTLIRRIRNHFAHHPLDTTFETDKVASEAAALSTFAISKESNPKTPRERNRNAFLLACGLFSMFAHQTIADRKNPTPTYSEEA